MRRPTSSAGAVVHRRAAAVDEVEVVERLQHVMAGIVEDVGAGMIVHAGQEPLERHAIVQVLAGVLIAGLGTGLVASYMGLQNLIVAGTDGPEERASLPAAAEQRAGRNPDIDQLQLGDDLVELGRPFLQRSFPGCDLA